MSLDKFRTYLESNNKVSKRRLPFYLNWVKSFIQYCQTQPDLIIPDHQIEPFLKQMSRNHEQWQVDQAKEATSLYCFFIGKDSKRNEDSGKPSIHDWKTAGDTMVRMLRLKQRSYRTEQTYLKWLRDFYIHWASGSDQVNRLILCFIRSITIGFHRQYRSFQHQK